MLFHKPPDDPIVDDDDGVYLTLAPPDPAPISLVTLAAELDEHPGALAHRLGVEVFVEPATGLRCVTVETCKRLLDERRELHEEMARRHTEATERYQAAERYQPPASLQPDPILESFAARGFNSGGRR